MKRRFAPVIFSVCLGMTASVMASGETVFVNMDKLYRNFYRTKLMITQLKSRAARVEKEHEYLVEEFNALKEKYDQLRSESLDDALSEEIRANKRNEAEEALIDLQNKNKEMIDVKNREGQQLQKDKSGMDKRILEQIRDAIRAEAQTKGYLAVLNVQNVGGSALQGVLMVPYYDADAEITDDVLKILNKGYVEEEAEEEEAEEAKAE